MKRAELLKRIKKIGGEFVRHGKKHDWYTNHVTKVSQPVPRHTEIPNNLAKHILKMLKQEI